MAPPQASKPRALAPKKEKKQHDWESWQKARELGGLRFRATYIPMVQQPVQVEMLAEATKILGEQSAPWQIGWNTQCWVNLFQSPEQMTKKVFLSHEALLKGHFWQANTACGWWDLFWFFCLFYKPSAAPFKWEWIPQSWYQTSTKPQGKLPRWQEGNNILEPPQE